MHKCRHCGQLCECDDERDMLPAPVDCLHDCDALLVGDAEDRETLGYYSEDGDDD